jgi:hypothetical protein
MCGDIKVQCSYNEGFSLLITTINLNSSIYQLKRKISEHTNLNIDDFDLLFQEKYLIDYNSSVKSFNLTNNSMIILKKCEAILIRCRNPFSLDSSCFSIRINQNESVHELKRRINYRLGGCIHDDFLLIVEGKRLENTNLSLKSYYLKNCSIVFVKL